jgi:DNA polymerase-1
MLVERWAKVLPWNPGSTKNVKEYLKARGYKIPIHYKTKEETTDYDALEDLDLSYPDDPVIPLIIQARQLGKGIGYLKDATLGEDGKLHPTFTDTPKTGRLASKKPNVMNLPQGRRGEITRNVAKAIRGSFMPTTPDMEFMELDWKGIEALLVGWFAEDEEYMRLARLGVHAALCAVKKGVKFDLAWDDDKLLALFDGLKKSDPIMYHLCKTVVHGSNYLMGIFLLSKELKLSVREAKEFQSTYFAMAPKVKKWQENTILRAHKDGYLCNPFGYQLPFFELFTFKNGKT